MSFLRSFSPWIVFAAVTPLDWRFGAVAGGVAGLLLAAHLRRAAGQPADALLLDLSSVVFFALVAVLAFADPGSPVRSWVGALSLAWLAATAWLSLAVGHPFTLAIARLSTPRELWGNPVFRRTNVIITMVWAATFTAVAAAVALVEVLDAGPVANVAVHLAYVVPIVFTRRYPQLVRARHAAAVPR